MTLSKCDTIVIMIAIISFLVYTCVSFSYVFFQPDFLAHYKQIFSIEIPIIFITTDPAKDKCNAVVSEESTRGEPAKQMIYRRGGRGVM